MGLQTDEVYSRLGLTKVQCNNNKQSIAEKNRSEYVESEYFE